MIFYQTGGILLLEDFEPVDYRISVQAYDLDNVLFSEGSQEFSVDFVLIKICFRRPVQV